MTKENQPEANDPKHLRVLIIDDSEDDTLLVIRELKKGGYDPEFERVETSVDMHKALQDQSWDVILCDYKMPKFSGLQAIAALKETNIDIPLIIVSGAIGEETAVECMRLGACDYIMKGNLSRLVPAIKRELQEAQSRRKRKQAEDDLLLKNIVFDASIAANSIADLSGTITQANDAFLRIWGYSSKDEVVGRPLIDFISSADETSAIINMLNTTGVWEGEYTAKRNDLSTFIAHGLATVIRDVKGTLIGYQSAVFDVTESRRVDDELRRHLNELQRWHAVTVDREGRVLELKKEVNDLLKEAGKPAKYGER